MPCDDGGAGSTGTPAQLPEQLDQWDGSCETTRDTGPRRQDGDSDESQG